MASYEKIQKLKAKLKIKRLIKILIETESFSDSYYVTNHASDALVSIGDEKVRILLMELLDSQNDRKIKVAAKTLARLKEVKAVESLANHLSSKNYEVREECIKAIYEISGSASVKYLVKMLIQEKAFSVPYYLAQNLLVDICENSIKQLMPYLKDENAYTVANTIIIIAKAYNQETLKEIENPELLDFLIEALTTADLIKKIILIVALSHFSESVSENLILEAVTDRDVIDYGLEQKILSALLAWKENPKMKKYLLELLVERKSVLLANGFLDYGNSEPDRAAREAIRNAGFEICSYEVDGWGFDRYYLADKDGNRIS